MLLEGAIGDAYGAAFEYVPLTLIQAHNDGATYRSHPRHNHAPGRYTDDTQMALAVAEVLLEFDNPSALDFANAFVRAFQRDQREGYAGGFYAFLQSVRDGQDFLTRIRPDSDKSGAAMRAAPIGWLRDWQRVREVATIQARVTHDTPDGIEAACASALLSHFCIWQGEPTSQAGKWIASKIGEPWARPWSGKVGGRGENSVRAAITAFERNTSLSDLLRDCIGFGGDVDTVATIALSSASMHPNYARDLPDSLLEGLEDGDFGRKYLQQTDASLHARFA